MAKVCLFELLKKADKLHAWEKLHTQHTVLEIAISDHVGYLFAKPINHPEIGYLYYTAYNWMCSHQVNTSGRGHAVIWIESGQCSMLISYRYINIIIAWLDWPLEFVYSQIVCFKIGLFNLPELQVAWQKCLSRIDAGITNYKYVFVLKTNCMFLCLKYQSTISGKI